MRTPISCLQIFAAGLLVTAACVEPPAVSVDEAALTGAGQRPPPSPPPPLASPCAVPQAATGATDDADPITPVVPDGVTTCATLAPTSLALFVGYDTSLRATRTDAEIRAWIDLQVADANQIFANSGMPIRYEPVFIREVSPDLPQFAGSSMMGVDQLTSMLRAWALNPHSVLRDLRDGYGADLAVFVAAPFTPATHDFCGVGNVPVMHGNVEVQLQDRGRLFGDAAFAIVRYDCGGAGAHNDFSLAHELGHTFGMNHGNLAVDGEISRAGYGAHFTPNAATPAVATVLDCLSVGTDAMIPLGVCTRIPHFSSPSRSVTVPACTGSPCAVATTSIGPSGVLGDNAALACARAERYAGFRTADGDQPPTVRVTSHHGQVLSGSTVSFSATATDPEQGDLAASIRWLDEAGALLGTGPSLTLQLRQPGERIRAQVTDAAGQVDEWWVTSPVYWPSDGYDDDDGNPSLAQPDLPLGTWQVRSFDRPDDLDHVTTGGVDGQRVRISVTGFTARVRPHMRVRTCDRVSGCNDWQDKTSPYEALLTATERVHVEVANELRHVGPDAAPLAGIDTDYLIRADVVVPAQAAPEVGPWYNPGRSGHGVDLQAVGGGQYVGVWYTYRADGTPTWYVSDVAPMYGRRWTAPLFESTWDGVRNRLRAVGSITFDWQSAFGATMGWTLAGTGAGVEPFQWYQFAGATGVANGLWYPPGQSGWGASIWHQAETLVLTTYTYDADGRPTWAQGTASGSPTDAFFSAMYQIDGADSLCPGCTGTTPRSVIGGVGTARFQLTDAAAGRAQFAIAQTYQVTAGGWAQSVDFARLSR